jgi:hypothetical protein
VAVLLFSTVGNRRSLATGVACAWVLAAFGCDTFSAPGQDGDSSFHDGFAGTAGSFSSAGVSGAAGTGATGGTSIPVLCTTEDNDGDGVTVLSAGCPTTLGFDTTDCNDFDPSVQAAAFVDSDGDGDGDPQSPACISSSMVAGFGFSSNGNDCNDTDPNVGPKMIDVHGDGLDRNCDGSDGTPDCSTQTWCPCDQELASAVDTSAACEGFDLVVFEVLACSTGCSQGTPYVRVANLGKQAADGFVSVAGPDGVPHRVADGLAAGAITEPFSWLSFDVRTLRVSSSDAGDCDPTNDLYEEPAGGLQPQCPK